MENPPTGYPYVSWTFSRLQAKLQDTDVTSPTIFFFTSTLVTILALLITWSHADAEPDSLKIESSPCGRWLNFKMQIQSTREGLEKQQNESL